LVAEKLFHDANDMSIPALNMMLPFIHSNASWVQEQVTVAETIMVKASLIKNMHARNTKFNYFSIYLLVTNYQKHVPIVDEASLYLV
jgi:hypothetical protein